MNLKDAPLYLKLKEYSSRKRISFAMPGHKGGAGIKRDFAQKAMKYDVTELHDTENLYHPKEALQKAKRLAGEYFGAEETYFMVNGSTSGIYAMIAAACSPGDTIIVNRACHMSVINACIMLGVKPEFVSQQILEEYCVPGGIDHRRLVEVLDRNDTAKAVLLTSPSYYGIASDIEAVANITRPRGIALLVDEAHGAHFPVDERIFPRTAMEQGADLSVCSAHKTLNALNQSAFLNFRGDIVDKHRLETVIAMQQTSSPSYVIAASADIARAEVSTMRGRAKWREIYDECAILRHKVMSKTDVVFISEQLSLTNDIYGVDETRIVMNFSNYNITGFEVSDMLRRKFNIDMEMADLFNVVGIATPANSRKDFSSLASAVIKICAGLKKSDEEPVFPEIPVPEMRMTPQQAFYAKGRNVRLDEAIGCVSRVTVVAYPPATPIICTGEIITEESIGYIEALIGMEAEITGLNANGFISIVEDYREEPEYEYEENTEENTDENTDENIEENAE